MVAQKLTPGDIWRRTFKQEKVKIILCHPAELGHLAKWNPRDTRILWRHLQ